MNVATSMIVILDYSKIDIEILGTDIETVKFDNCREVSGDDGDTNGILVVI